MTDHCKAIECVFKNGKIGEVYNVGSENEWSNIDLVKKIIHLLQDITDDNCINEKLIKYVKDRAGHDFRYSIDSSK